MGSSFWKQPFAVLGYTDRPRTILVTLDVSDCRKRGGVAVRTFSVIVGGDLWREKRSVIYNLIEFLDAAIKVQSLRAVERIYVCRLDQPSWQYRSQSYENLTGKKYVCYMCSLNRSYETYFCCICCWHSWLNVRRVRWVNFTWIYL